MVTAPITPADILVKDTYHELTENYINEIVQLL